MSTKTLAENVPSQEVDFPIGHIVFEINPTVALCGKKLLGIPAPPDVEVCVVCREMEQDLQRLVGGDAYA